MIPLLGAYKVFLKIKNFLRLTWKSISTWSLNTLFNIENSSSYCAFLGVVRGSYHGETQDGPEGWLSLGHWEQSNGKLRGVQENQTEGLCFMRIC